MRSLLVLVALGAFLPTAPLAAQVPPGVAPTPALQTTALQPVELPPDLCAALGIHRGTAQDLLLPSAVVPFQVDVQLDGRHHTLRLEPHDVRSADFSLYLHDASGLHRLPTPPSVTLRGTVSGRDGGDVAATLVAGQLQALILLPDGTQWAVQPLSAANAALPRASHAVYRATDARTEGLHCGVTALAPPHAGGGGSTAPAAMRVAQLAVDADLAYYTHWGSNSTTVQNQITGTINNVNSIYRRDVEIEHRITSIIVRTTNVYSWNGDLCNLLSQFRTRWRNNHGSIARDMAHLFTGEGSFSGVVGCAYVGVVCGNSAYGSSKAFSGSISTDTGLVAHEMGHNWSAGHCDNSPPCNIMCSGLGGCAGSLGAFGPTSINSILAHKNSRTCLDDPTPPNPPSLTSLNPSSIRVYGGGEVTVTGLYLDTVTGLTVSGIPTFVTLVNATSLRFSLPGGIGIGQHPIVAANLRGPSNTLQLDVTSTHPSVISISPLLQRGSQARIEVHSDVNWVGDFLLSTSSAPSTFPGIVTLGLGNGFTDLTELGLVFCGASAAGSITFPVPADLPAGLDIYWQAITLDPTNITLPLEASNIATSRLL